MRKALSIISLVLVIAIVITGLVIGFTKKAEYNYVLTAMSNAVSAIKDGTWTEVEPGNFGGSAAGDSSEDHVSEAPDVTFEPGTYGGINFTSVEDVANYYNTVYNATKAERADYKNGDGSIESFYKMVGEEHLTLKEGSLLVDGKANSILNGAAPGIIARLAGGGVNGLSPSSNRNPDLDTDENGESLTTSRVTAEDILKCGIVDNGDGTITITIVPQSVNMSHKGMDAQGHFFNALGAIDSTIQDIGVTWASGTTEENCKVIYEDGSAVVTVDTATGIITNADYRMIVNINVIHANMLVLKDRSAALTIYYDCHYPASDEYLLDSKQLTRV